MWTKARRRRGVTLFEGLVTALILFLILSAVISLLQTSLRAMKNQQGREISEVTFVQEMLRRDLSDAVRVTTGANMLNVQRSDYTVAWQQMLTSTAIPSTLPKLEVRYLLTEGSLTRLMVNRAPVETLITLEKFESAQEASDVQVKLAWTTGQRHRQFVWNFWCPAL